MVSRGYQAPVAERVNWITLRPSWPIALIWGAVLAVALGLTAQTAVYILLNGLVAARPSLSAAQTSLRVLLMVGALSFLAVRRDLLERAMLIVAVIAAASAALFGFGLRSPALSAVRLVSHLVLYAFAAVVAWRVLLATRREAADRT
jgi:hypothetical protein